jgi:hypothetical protein
MPIRQHGRSIGTPRERQLASLAAGLNRGAPIQRLAALDAALAAGRLSLGQVSMPTTRQDLPAHEVATLAGRVGAIGRPGARPLPAAVRDGRATLDQRGVAVPSLPRADSGAAIARSVTGLDPQAARLEVGGGRYALHARLNPWIEVINGVITDYQDGPWNKSMPSNWAFVKVGDLQKVGLTSQNAVGRTWPGGTLPKTGNSGFTIPSKTYDPTSMSVHFHNLPHDELPMTTKGTPWNKQKNQWHLLRDPLIEPSSPKYDVDEDMGQGGNVYSSTIEYPQNKKRMLLSVSSVTSPKGGTYKGKRDYPMSSSDYVDPSGITMGRGHGIDHADGNDDTTTNPFNYTPQNVHWNEGARNHLVRKARNNGGGKYKESYEYGSNPKLTVNGTPIPERNHFMMDSSGTQEYYNIPTYGYPQDRKLVASQPFQQPYSNRPNPNHF